jgi:hypothetical protein
LKPTQFGYSGVGSETTEEEIVAWSVKSDHPGQKLKKHHDDEEDPGAGFGGTNSSVGVSSGPNRTTYRVVTHRSNCV